MKDEILFFPSCNHFDELYYRTVLFEKSYFYSKNKFCLINGVNIISDINYPKGDYRICYHIATHNFSIYTGDSYQAITKDSFIIKKIVNGIAYQNKLKLDAYNKSL